MPSLSTNGVANQQKTTSFLFFPLKKPLQDGTQLRLSSAGVCGKQNAAETTTITTTTTAAERHKGSKSFQAPFLLCLRGNFCEHNISCCVAFCFVSAKAAVHRRKNLDWLWIAALPTESGTAPAERRGEERSCLQCGIMFPQYSHKSPADISTALCRVVFFYTESRSFH